MPKCVHNVRTSMVVRMSDVTSQVSTRELREQLSDVLSRAMYAGERIGVTRNGKLSAVVISVADLEALEAFEMESDVAAYREAIAEDDGQRVSLEALRRELST
ncbi:prevent-host-death family protein [Agrococcus baldri]|uniref:Antitoxin n=2 Tax=Agrococcus baldri TaxID=153730 RepID=A0AA94KZQ8_9MICO|nr:prevent-host-death family protein [Agrococcus baldri]